MSTKVTFTNSQIQFIVTNEVELQQFNISINSCYDDIINLKLKVNVKTTKELLPIVQTLKMNNGVNVNITTSSTEGIIIPNNCLVLPNTIAELKDDEVIDENHDLVQVMTPDNLKDLINSISTTCIIPKKILLFKESDILPKEYISLLMRSSYSVILKGIHDAEIIQEDVKKINNKPSTVDNRVEQEYDQHFTPQ